MLSKLIRELLFKLLHLVLTVLVALQYVYRRFSSLGSYSRKTEVSKSEIKLILKLVSQAQKKLHHLVVLADNDDLDIGTLSRLVIWSMVAGIPYVSFYDHTGKLFEQEEKLFLEIELRKKGIPGCIKWSDKPDLNGYSNGIKPNTVHINIIRNEDGREKISQCVKSIANGEIVCPVGDDPITAQELDKVLSFIYPTIPDPDVVLYTGPVCCTHGLLPWQIRLTEFIQLSVNSDVSVDSYLCALNKYYKCDQRFGK